VSEERGGEGQGSEDRLADLVFRLGEQAGRLALGMELITDALCLVGQHPAYCRPDSRTPPRDIALVLADLARAKDLVQEVFLALRAEREGKRSHDGG
jgi:hypothetical protein